MKYGWTPREVAALPNRQVLELLAAHRLEAERANRTPIISRRP